MYSLDGVLQNCLLNKTSVDQRSDLSALNNLRGDRIEIQNRYATFR